MNEFRNKTKQMAVDNKPADRSEVPYLYRYPLRFVFFLVFGVTACAVQDYKPAPMAGFMYEKDSPAVSRIFAGSPMPPADTDAPTQHAETPLAVTERARVLGLQEAIGETLASPAILSAAENISQASAALWTVSTPPNPTLTVSQTLIPLDRSFTVTRQGGPPQFDAGIQFPIDWLVFGKRSAAMDSAKLETDVAGAEFADMVRLRLAATVAAFYDVLEARELLALARQDVENLRQIFALTERQVQLGALASIEADRVRLAVLDSEREVQRREAAVQSVKATLRAALGRANDATDFDIDGQLDVAAAEKPLSVEAAFNLAEQYRPDIVATRLKISKAEADVRFEERKALPELTPFVGYTRQFQEKAIGFPDANAWGAGFSVTMPIFDRNQGGIGKANSLLVQSRYNLQERLLQLRDEIAQAAEGFKLSHAFVTADLPARIAAAKSVFERIKMAYQLGDRSLLEILDAQRNYRDFTRSAITDRAAYWKALHRLNAVIGKRILK
ncbi:MAG: TolC family protein [Gammaproteobacteria bacterium]